MPVASDPSRPIVNHIGISGGKDSTALMLWALHESGYPKESLDFTFCDTDNEHDLTYDQIVMLSEHSVAHGGPKIQWLKPALGFYELAKMKGRFPSPRSRFCTQHLKIYPTQKHIRHLISEGFSVVNHSGIRASESDERAKMVKREDVSEFLSEYRPLLRWSIDDVWAIHRKYGVPINPLYEKGFGRVGCCPCIMSRKEQVKLASVHAIRQIDRIRDEEESEWKNGQFHPFFGRKMVPARFHSRRVVKKDGRAVLVATIDDAVRWATEDPHAGQLSMFEELKTDVEDRTMCQSTWGLANEPHGQ